MLECVQFYINGLVRATYLLVVCATCTFSSNMAAWKKCGPILSKIISFLWVFFRFHKGLKKSRTNLPKDDYADSLFFPVSMAGSIAACVVCTTGHFSVGFFLRGKVGDLYNIHNKNDFM